MESTNEHSEMKLELQKFRESFQRLLDHSEQRDIKVDEMVGKVEEMYQVFNNGTFLITVVKWSFGILLTLGGAYLMIKQILHLN